jgi:hypothetical protein
MRTLIRSTVTNRDFIAFAERVNYFGAATTRRMVASRDSNSIVLDGVQDWATEYLTCDAPKRPRDHPSRTSQPYLLSMGLQKGDA